MKKPEQCCECGTYEHQVPMALNGRRHDIDLCIADIVAALNAANIATVASCCGHGKGTGSIVLEDGRELQIASHPRRNRENMTGSEMISAERQRQIEKEGWTPEHDEQHS